MSWVHWHGRSACPIGFDTDVNGAVLGEARWGVARGLDTAIYITIGTGIGGGALIGGSLSHGLVHPEMGHLLVPREPDDASFEGACPFHGARCWEGLASGPALARRWGQPAESLPADHPAWDLEARYIASALTTLVLVLSPERLILGGGVMQRVALFPPRASVPEAFAQWLRAGRAAAARHRSVRGATATRPTFGDLGRVGSGRAGGARIQFVESRSMSGPQDPNQPRPKDPLHGITLEEIVRTLVERYGWESSVS